MKVLVDTSIWIDYFREGSHSTTLDQLIDDNLIVTNEIILTELIPYLTIKKQSTIISLLHNVKCLPLQINWDEIINLQVKCLKSGANGIGIPDLIIAQNAKFNDCAIYSLDKHFKLLNKLFKLRLV